MMSQINPAILLMTILRGGGVSVSPVLTVNFATDDAAPLTSPYAGELGSLTIVETDGTFTVSGGVLTYTAQTTAAWGDQRFYGAGVARQAGRTLKTLFRYSRRGRRSTSARSLNRTIPVSAARRALITESPRRPVRRLITRQTRR
jgi:hypothetical protein